MGNTTDTTRMSQKSATIVSELVDFTDLPDEINLGRGIAIHLLPTYEVAWTSQYNKQTMMKHVSKTVITPSIA